MVKDHYNSQNCCSWQIFFWTKSNCYNFKEKATFEEGKSSWQFVFICKLCSYGSISNFLLKPSKVFVKSAWNMIWWDSKVLAVKSKKFTVYCWSVTEGTAISTANYNSFKISLYWISELLYHMLLDKAVHTTNHLRIDWYWQVKEALNIFEGSWFCMFIWSTCLSWCEGYLQLKVNFPTKTKASANMCSVRFYFRRTVRRV